MQARIWLSTALLAVPVSAVATAPETFPTTVPGPELAPIALLVDVSSGQTLFERQPDQSMLPASMTKAMTALIAFDLIKAGRLSEQAVFTVSPETASRWSGQGTSLWLRAGEKVTVGELLAGLATASANDAAAALAEGALGSEQSWIAAMNRRAASLGMTRSHFASVNGLPDGGETVVSARDMTRLGQALIGEHPELYHRYIGRRSIPWRGEMLASHDPISGLLPGADGIKTGHTTEAGYTFLGSVVREGRRLMLVIGQAPTERARAIAARSLAEWGFAAWDSEPFLHRGARVGTVRVQQGALRHLPVAPQRDYALAFARGTQQPRVTATIVYTGPLIAPIRQGQPVAELDVAPSGQPHYRLPLVATQDVLRAGPFDRIVNGLLGWFE